MDKDIIAPERFNAGYNKGYKECLRDDIQIISLPILQIFCSVTDREAKVVDELREVKKEAQEMYVKFVENQEALEKENKEVERLRHGYDYLDT